MKLYLVRHGETNSNVKKTIVSPNDELTVNGIKQAKILAERFLKIPIELILSSPHKRTIQTASAIGGQINKKITANELLRERKWPSDLEGKPLKNPEVKRFLELLKQKTQEDPEWHYSNEESFLDIKNRASMFVEHVSGLDYQNILAVSHEYFIKIIVAYMMFGNKLTYDLFRDFFFFTTLNNTSITLCETKENMWKLVTFNRLD
ncbi:histidine phosphatase family protein [Patescibacteria group bacterium]|nr:histidine phosphatase family protein [Patescibacteria group bacterium]